jgi:hypothetical protein
MTPLDNTTTTDHLAKRDRDSLQSDKESQQTTIPTQLPEKTKESPQPNVNSSYEEYLTAFKLAMVVVALVLAMFLVSQNKILSQICTDAMK